jgi:tripartite-type tricarboxylate transporter receptor subunit TctC
MTCLRLALAALLALPLVAAAQSAKPLKIMIGSPAGGPLDAHAGLLSDSFLAAEMPKWAKAGKDAGARLD